MPLPVQLKDVLEAMDPIGDMYHAYLNRETGEIVTCGEEDISMAEGNEADMPEWFLDYAPRIREAISSTAYVVLPGRFEFHEHRVMERFARSLPEAELSDTLLGALHGRGAFRRFKDIIYSENLDSQWHAYRDEALKQLGIEFLEDEVIPFVDV